MDKKDISMDTRQAVREAIDLGWTYADIRLGTGASTGVIADVKRKMGLIASTRHRTTNDVLAAAKAMVLTGQTYAVIHQATGAPINAIKALKKEAGLMKPRRSSGVVASDVAAAIREAVAMGMSYSEIKTQFRVSSSMITDAKRQMGLLQSSQTPTPPPQPAQDMRPDPSEYFQAIRDGILDGYAREQALSDRVALLQARITELESQNISVQRTLTQTRARMSNWAGPVPLPHRNLSTGG